MKLAAEMRAAGLRVELLSPDRGLKALLRRADKIGARYAVIIGDNELSREVVMCAILNRARSAKSRSARSDRRTRPPLRRSPAIP